MKRTQILTISCACAVFGASRPVDYEWDIRPILQQKCYVCHGSGIQSHGLRLDHEASARPVLVPAGLGEAEFVRRITSPDASFRMPPPMAAPLSPEDIGTLVSWVREGAPWPAQSGDSGAVGELVRAIDQNRVRTVHHLLQDQALVNTRGPDLTTPLMHAALNARIDILDLLLKAGADPNAIDAGGATALIWAVHDVQKVRRLISAGARVNEKTKLGTTVLIVAAAFADSPPVVKQLLAAGANVNAANTDGATALSQASAAGNFETMRLLLANGADPHLVPGGLSPLSAAAYFGNQKAVELLLERGVRPIERDGYGATALHAAALVGERRIAQILLEHGGDANLPVERPLPSGQYLGTPLAMSSYTQPDGQIAQLLIHYGADVNASTSDGETVIERARSAGHSRLVDILTEAGDRTDARQSPAAIESDARRTSATVADLRASVERSLALLQRGSLEFVRESGCASCHNHHLPAIAIALARQRGFHLDESQIRQASDITRTALDGQRDRALHMMFVGGAVGLGYAFLELAATGEPAGTRTTVFLRNLVAQQLPSGKWRPSGARPPQEFSDITATALAVHAIKRYVCKTPEWQTDCRARIRRARSWLLSVKPASTEDFTFQLLGLFWAGVDRKLLRDRIRSLLSLQRPDGGWGQLPSLPSDAYATGEALYALSQAGVSASDSGYRNGVQFLLKTQCPDGSWLVQSRTLRFQPYFEGGFPHGPNQFISAAGTSWAVIALMLGYDLQANGRSSPAGDSVSKKRDRAAADE